MMFLRSRNPFGAGTVFQYLRVLQSAAGYYVGRVEISPEGYEFPYCRESGYYPTREKAESALAFLCELEHEPE